MLAETRTMDTLGEFKFAKGRHLDVDNNRSGAASLSSTTQDPTTGLIWPWTTCVLAVYGEEILWSGPVITRSTDMKARRVSIGAVGWFERLMHINIQDQTLTYTSQDAGAIITALLAKAVAQDPSIPITMGIVESSQNRTITYNRDQNIGQAIMDLGELESGIDWYVDPTTRKLNVIARRGVDRPEVKWFYLGDKRSHQSNLDNCVENVDGGTIANDIRPRGRFSSGFAVDLQSQDQYGLFQDAPALASVSDQNILDAYANAEIVYRAQPGVTYTLSPKSSIKTTVPRLFTDFDLGDTTYLTARGDYVNVDDQAVRVFGVSLDIRDDGTEQITNLQVLAGGS